MNFKKILILLCFISAFSLNAQEEQTKEIFKVVEQMPRFYSEECEEFAEDDLAEAKSCAQKAMLEFIYSNIKYPPKARESGIQGTVVIRFVVREDGWVEDAEILRNVDGGCGEEALRVVEMMPDWLPGVQRGRAVSVYYNLPIKFGLENAKRRSN